jgi:hypothetical protein
MSITSYITLGPGVDVFKHFFFYIDCEVKFLLQPCLMLASKTRGQRYKKLSVIYEFSL